MIGRQVGIYFLHKYLLKLVAEEDPRNGGANGIGLYNVPIIYLGTNAPLNHPVPP